MDTPLIGPIDLLLVPLYFIILYFIFSTYKKKHPKDLLLQKYFIKGFVVKILGALFFALLVFYFYKVGDMLSYFQESIQLRDLLSDGKITFTQVFSEDYEYFRDRFDLLGSVTDSGFVVTKISFLLSYLSFSRFLPATCIMAALVYIGVFKLFRAFVALAPDSHRFISIIVLFFPTIVIYGSGIFKDPICFSALGWFFFTSQQMFNTRKVTVTNILVFIASLIIIVAVKAYIIAAFVIPFCFFLVMMMVKKIQSWIFRIAAFLFLCGMLAGMYIVFKGAIDESLGNYAVKNLSQNVHGLQTAYSTLSEEDAGSNFDIGEIEPTFTGLLQKMPAGIVATLYRPFLWEVRKPFILLTAVESFAIVLFTLIILFRTGIRKFFSYILSDANIFLCLGFSLIFAGFVGVSTPNFGTLARYRIPAIPFYLFGLLLILKKINAYKAAARAITITVVNDEDKKEAA